MAKNTTEACLESIQVQKMFYGAGFRTLVLILEIAWAWDLSKNIEILRIDADLLK